MKRTSTRPGAVAARIGGAAAALVLAASAPAFAQATTTFGSLSNFDVFNDTGQECHGFEIELDGISSSDVVYSFGAPYERYGDPVVVDFPGGVYVRYQSPYDAGNGVFTQATPMAPAVITPTDGHACWTGGSGTYLTSGCEHFGLSLAANPTKTVYRWLVADAANPGSLQPSGTNVSIPAPIWNVQAPPPAAPDQVNPVVVAVIQAPEPDAHEYGEALWVKVYETEAPDPADLDHLLSDDPAVPQEAAEVEIEWTLLQSRVGFPAAGQLESQGQVKADSDSVTRRYEFYEYVGAFDPETNEATPGSDSNPDPSEIGNYIGAQMAAANFRGAVVGPTSTTTSTTVTTTSLVADSDGDGVDDNSDNCEHVANSDQSDLDGDELGNVCDDADAPISVKSASIKAKSSGLSAVAKGGLATAAMGDSIDLTAGLTAAMNDGGATAIGHDFGATDCAVTNGRIRCRSADKSAQLVLTPNAKNAGNFAWVLKLKGPAAGSPMDGPLAVRISQAASVDRVGQAIVCRRSAGGLSCR